MVAPPLLDVPSYFFHSIRFPLDHPMCDDFQKLAHPSQTLYRQLSRMVQLITSFQTKPLFFPKNSLDPRPFRLHPRLDFNRTFLYTIIQGRDTTRASHKSRL